MNKPIYFDNHATTPLDPRVFQEMLPYLKENFGNASSIDHIYGNLALEAVNKAREKIALLINCDPDEIIFTSGATESDNLALRGVINPIKEKNKSIITCKIEHKAILDTCHSLEKEGLKVIYLDVNKDGNIDIKKLRNSIDDNTVLITLMAANNEIGTINPLNEIGKIAKEKGILFHTDASQAFGHIPLDVKKMNIDLLSISGHKIYGPKGIGALYVRKGIKLSPLIYGGGHERGFRSGTLNVPGIVGLGTAAEISRKDLNINYKKIKNMRDKLLENISSKVEVEINGTMENRLPHNLSLFFKGINSKALINDLKDIVALSAGSACTSDSIKPSYVITLLGYDEERAFSTIRIGIGRFTKDEEIEKVSEAIIKSVNKLRNL